MVNCHKSFQIETFSIYQLLLFVGMVLKLFNTFYDEECVKEEVFWNWLRRPNPAKKNDQIQLIESTRKFFIWLSQSTSSTIKDIDNDDDSSSDVDNDDDDDSSNVDKSNDANK